MVFRFVAIAFFSGFLGISSAALAQGPACGHYAVIRNMIERQSETLKFRGISQTGSHVSEIFVNDREGSDGGFTVVVRRALDGKTCVVFSGFGFGDVRGETPWAVPDGEES